MLYSLAAAALFAGGAEAQHPIVYGGGLRSKPAVQPQPRPVATFATPYPTRPTPGPVRTIYDPPPQQAAPSAVMPVIQPQASRPVALPRPGGAAAPGAAGKVLYFHKSENATAPDGMVDNSTLAMAGHQEPAPGEGIPDVSAAPPGIPQPVAIPTTVIEKPIVPPNLEPLTPSQPFIPLTPEIPALPTTPQVVAQPEEKKDEKKDPPLKVQRDPKALDLGPEVTALPPRSAIFTIYDNDSLERIIYGSIGKQLGKTADEQKKSTPFPALKPTVPPGTQYVSKTDTLPPGKVVYEPGFVIHRRLHFEEKNSERYGWDLGLATPFVSTASFYKNLLLWPSSLASVAVVGSMDTNAGKCLPGSPTPYYLYPPGLTITGGVAEGLVITGLAFVIP